jgi:hypothetical protein
MLKDRRTYEIMRPEDVGVPQATLVLGKHSGRHAVQRQLELQRMPIGGAALAAGLAALPEETLDACLGSDAVLLGAVGDPAFDSQPWERRPESGLLALRKALGVYANLRPARAWPGLEASAPLRPERLAGTDILIVRELTGGLYFGEPRGWDRQAGEALNTLRYTRGEIERVAVIAFDAAGTRAGRVTSVDKANVLETSQLWRAGPARCRLDHTAAGAPARSARSSPPSPVLHYARASAPQGSFADMPAPLARSGVGSGPGTRPCGYLSDGDTHICEIRPEHSIPESRRINSVRTELVDRPAAPCSVASESRVEGSKESRRLMVVVAAAGEGEVSNRGLAASRIRHLVVKFQPAGLRAPSLVSNERAAPLIARPYLPFYSGGDVARALFERGCVDESPAGKAEVLGCFAAASLVFSRCSRSIVRARSKTAPGSPSGIECRSRSVARRSFSRVPALIVICTL